MQETEDREVRFQGRVPGVGNGRLHYFAWRLPWTEVPGRLQSIYRVSRSWAWLKWLSREGNGTPLQYSCLENSMDGGAWWAAVHGVAKSQTRLSDFTFTFHLHALEKEMATHSSVLAWRIPGTGEPGELTSMGSHRVGHDWSDLAAAAAAKRLSMHTHTHRNSDTFLVCFLLHCCLLGTHRGWQGALRIYTEVPTQS